MLEPPRLPPFEEVPPAMHVPALPPPRTAAAPATTGADPAPVAPQTAAAPFTELFDEDPATRDRRAALAELAPRFQVVDPSVNPEERLPNQVTQEELEKLAGNFSDIRRGVGGIQIRNDE